MPEKPILHGRDHRPGGADPIPGTGMQWCKGSMASFLTISASATSELSMDTTLDYTNASSIYSMGRHGSGSYGIAIAASGHYLFKAQLIVRNFASTGQVEVSFINYSPDATPSSYGSEGRFWTRQTGDSTEDGWYLDTLVSVDSGGPSTEPMLWSITNNTGGTMQAFIDVIVIQFDTDATSIV